MKKDPKVTEYLEKLVEYTWDVAFKTKAKALLLTAAAEANGWSVPIPLAQVVAT